MLGFKSELKGVNVLVVSKYESNYDSIEMLAKVKHLRLLARV